MQRRNADLALQSPEELRAGFVQALARNNPGRAARIATTFVGVSDRLGQMFDPESLEMLKQAYDAIPSYKLAKTIGMRLLGDNQLDEAIDYFKQAFAIEPRAFVAGCLSDIYTKLYQDDEAAKWASHEQELRDQGYRRAKLRFC